jgi:hypothetical protein
LSYTKRWLWDGKGGDRWIQLSGHSAGLEGWIRNDESRNSRIEIYINSPRLDRWLMNSERCDRWIEYDGVDIRDRRLRHREGGSRWI